MRDASLEAAVRRIYDRYVQEFVEPFGFCPWAKKARESGAVSVRVCDDVPWSAAWAKDTYDDIAAQPHLDIGILIFPRLRESGVLFGERVNAFLSQMEAATTAGPAPMVMAPFHPDAPDDASTIGRLTTFIRRAPDPTIQLVRATTLMEVRAQHAGAPEYIDPDQVDLEALLKEPAPPPPLHERIVRTNQETLAQIGLSRLLEILNAVMEDRAASYAPFGA